MSDQIESDVTGRLSIGCFTYILAFEEIVKPVVNGLLDLILLDPKFSSTELEQVSDAMADIAGWFARCTDDLNRRTFAIRREEEARSSSIGFS